MSKIAMPQCTFMCEGCSGVASAEESVVANDQVWHERCLKCSDCNSQLTLRCYLKNGHFYCKADYFRRFGPKCSGCQLHISPDEKFRKAKELFFHIACYKCCECHQRFLSGDILHLVDETILYCNNDFYKIFGSSKDCGNKKDQMKSAPTRTPTVKMDNFSLDKTDRESACHTRESPKDLILNDIDMDCRDEDRANLADIKVECGALPINNGKRRGPRTTIKPKQLEMLKIAFLATPKPTRHMREKLAEETGLGMRVIQVWFQNRRSKERRIKQISSHRGRDHLFNDNCISTKYRALQNCERFAQNYDKIGYGDAGRYAYEDNNFGSCGENNTGLLLNDGVFSPDVDNRMTNIIQNEEMCFDGWNSMQSCSKMYNENWRNSNQYPNSAYDFAHSTVCYDHGPKPADFI